ncbi:MAG: hypothetical protein ACHQDD_10725 [Steroidobacterales bacterium]
MKILIRIGGLAALAAFMLLRLWLGVLGLAAVIAVPWAIVVAVALLLCRLTLPLQTAMFVGAFTAWHWPLLPAVIVAAPRLVLVLPGLISTFLAGRRHPRPRWSSPPAV